MAFSQGTAIKFRPSVPPFSSNDDVEDSQQPLNADEHDGYSQTAHVSQLHPVSEPKVEHDGYTQIAHDPQLHPGSEHSVDFAPELIERMGKRMFPVTFLHAGRINDVSYEATAGNGNNKRVKVETATQEISQAKFKKLKNVANAVIDISQQ